MGILGRGTPAAMVSQLEQVSKAYAAADPSHPVQPALELVTVVAQASAGPNGWYSAMMSTSTIQQELALANAHHFLLILDVQIGHGSVKHYVKALEPFLKQPNVELALDPEFDMAPGNIPGKEFGRMYAQSINWAADYLSHLAVRQNEAQKILIVHQFRKSMLPDWYNIRTAPRVALVKDMDGFGGQQIKQSEYQYYIGTQATPCFWHASVAPQIAHYNLGAYHLLMEVRHPVCGAIKLFYRQDTHLFTPKQVVQLDPSPMIVIYQ